MNRNVLFVTTAVLAWASASAASPAGSHPLTTSAGFNVQALPPQLPQRPYAKTLYNQNSNDSGTGVDSQCSESPCTGAYGDYSQGADDFVIPKGQTWKIGEVDVTGVYYNGYGPATSENVYFYKTKGGLPGRPVKDGTFMDVAGSDNAGSFAIVLPKKLKLGAGHYWVSVQVNCGFETCGEWGWEGNSVQHHDPAAWRSPGSSCSNWGTLEECGVGGGPDFMFDLKK
jgi:hypothetical protein